MIYIIWFLPPLIIVVLVAYGVITLRRFSKALFGTPDPLEGLKKQKMSNSFKPKSLNSMELVYLPRIKRDFPQLSVEELKKKGEGTLLSAFGALASKDEELLSQDLSKEVRQKIRIQLKELQEKNQDQFYDRVEIHKTVISDYKKDHGQVWITLQTALEGYIYLLKDGKLIQGERDYLSQEVYTLYYLYVQDVDLLNNKEALGLNCPNCGAPVKNLGSKFCDYCGSGIQEINLRVWRLVDYKKE
ncbi:MAG: zinc ribbon domain-containing protein [Tissierellia bacterium]|nr:zinc ribbon domain-containing protein [Tissierellia bacterium]